jgi:hypothetical protein
LTTARVIQSTGAVAAELHITFLDNDAGERIATGAAAYLVA